LEQLILMHLGSSSTESEAVVRQPGWEKKNWLWWVWWKFRCH